MATHLLLFGHESLEVGVEALELLVHGLEGRRAVVQRHVQLGDRVLHLQRLLHGRQAALHLALEALELVLDGR